jgi:hypothetical protein
MTQIASKPNTVNRNLEIKDTNASGDNATIQKTTNKLNTVDGEPKENNEIDKTCVTQMQTNKEMIATPVIPNPTKTKDTTSIGTTQEIDKLESQLEIRRSTRKRTSPDKFSECGAYNTRKRCNAENDMSQDMHNPTSKRILPMRKHKTGLDLQSHERIEMKKKLTNSCKTQEHMSNKGCNSTDTTNIDNTDNGNLSIGLVNGETTNKCVVGMCAGYACDYTRCLKCERFVHSNDHCSILCSHPNVHTNGLYRHRVCIDCYRPNGKE